MPPGGALAFRPHGQVKFGVGGDEHAQPLRLARTEPVHQVIQIVVVAGGCQSDLQKRDAISDIDAGGLPP